MGAKLIFKYYRDADILRIAKRSPYPGQEAEELGDEFIAPLNPATGEVENLEVLFFSTRILRSELSDNFAMQTQIARYHNILGSGGDLDRRSREGASCDLPKSRAGPH